jgi:hypothetical protein
MKGQASGFLLGLLFLSGLLTGCSTVNPGNDGQVQSYSYPVIESEWIRNGEPIIFQNSKWYPQDDYEILQDSDVFQVAEYKGVQVFVEKISTKPYQRIYTKFDKNRFRYWEERDDD